MVVSFANPAGPFCLAAYLGALSKNHLYWNDECMSITATSYEDSFCAFLTVMTDLEQLSSLGVQGLDDGPFRDCPICADGPAGGKSPTPHLKLVSKAPTLLPTCRV